MGVFKRFKTDQNGATAVIFGLSFLPFIGLAGAAIDYSRASDVRTHYQLSVDAAALALVSMPQSATAQQLTERAQAVFNSAVGNAAHVATRPVSAAREGTQVTVAASASVTNAFMQIFGFKTTEVAVVASADAARPNIELALVLDNTGSMREEIDGRSKMYWLKKQAKSLLVDLASIATTPDSVRVSLVPFDTQVRLDPAQYAGKDWLRWDVPGGSRNWDGYIIDRYGTFATSDAAPTGEYSRYPAVKNEDGRPLTAMRPLTSLYSSNSNRNAALDSFVNVVEAMQPRGNTDLTLGVMWGLATLTKAEPFTETADANVLKYMVVLTDGKNTENHIDGRPNIAIKNDGTTDPVIVDEINRTTRAACSAVKDLRGSGEIEVFTIRLVEGDEGLLRDCASRPGNYFDVKTPTDLKKAFEAVRDRIFHTRITS